MSLGEGFSGLVRRVGRVLDSRAAPWAVGLSTMALIGWLWGSLDALPWVYDESAYLLQAEIFATGRWAAPGRPLPEFFEQMHVFVTPKLVPKYPPGHALVMVPGIWLGLPGLVPLLATGLSGALVFLLARALASDPWIAFATWAVWLTSPVELYIRPSYMSQITTGLTWLVGWWALLRWRADRRLRWLLVFSAVFSVGAITRPITMLAFGLVAGGWLLVELGKRRELARLGSMILVALPILLIAPLWSHRTSGRTHPTPYSEWSRVYAPWNMPGFRVDSSRPLREEAPAMRKFRTEFLPQHRAHRPANLPGILVERAKWIAITFWGERGLRWMLLPLGFIGMIVAPPPVRLGLATAGLLVLTYLWIAARPRWTVYYLEAMPVLGLVTAVGAGAVARSIAQAVARWRRRGDLEATVHGLFALGLLVGMPGTMDRLIRARQAQIDVRYGPAELESKIRTIPGEAIVFLRTGPAHRPHDSYLRNVPDLERERVWLALDRGEDNLRLLVMAPDRAAYVFDPATGELAPWPGGRP